jgi:tetratricopeptide (TPR) repeat protein
MWYAQHRTEAGLTPAGAGRPRGTEPRDTDHARFVTHAHNSLGAIHHSLGDDDEAARQYQQALQVAIAAGTPYPQVEALLGRAAAHRADQPRLARAHADQALALSRRIGYRMLEGQARRLCQLAHSVDA